MNNTKTLQKHKLGLSGFLRNWAAALAVVLCLVIFYHCQTHHVPDL